MMTHSEIRGNFTKFFKERGHKIMPSSSLLPTDPSVLFTTAGMQQFKSYYTGQADAMKDFGSLNTASIQKSMRTSDIDEVGDGSHLTFFEMLGNFSFGGYKKEKAIMLGLEFLISKMEGVGLDHSRISATYYSGNKFSGTDIESKSILQNQHFLKDRVEGKDDNVWGPTGNEGPCGPTVEFYVDGVEVWNIVFNEFYCNPNKSFKPLKYLGVDTGMGLERLTMVVQGKKNIFETDLLGPILQFVPSELDIRTKRIIADHSRAIAFLIADGIRPSNKEQGYVLRRLMRRIITYFFVSPVDKRLAMSFIHRSADSTLMSGIFAKIVEIYGPYYPELDTSLITREFDQEKEKFEKTLRQGLRELEKFQKIDAQSAFRLYESFGLPYEIIKELGNEKAKSLSREEFDEEFKKHREQSRTGAKKKFGGHGLLLDTGELKVGNEEELKKATRLHTATHLLHAALRKILGEEVRQQGSDITPERLRFDFTFSRKMTLEEIKQVEDTVNEVIQKDYKVTKEEMLYEDAIKSGALAFFKQKYPPRVNVYTIADPSNPSGLPFSRELCGGPHVSRTAEIGKIKIIKEGSISAGVRRIRAVVE